MSKIISERIVFAMNAYRLKLDEVSKRTFISVNTNVSWGDPVEATFDEFQKQATQNGSTIKMAIRNGCDVILDQDDEVVAVSVSDYTNNQKW